MYYPNQNSQFSVGHTVFSKTHISKLIEWDENYEMGATRMS